MTETSTITMLKRLRDGHHISPLPPSWVNPGGSSGSALQSMGARTDFHPRHSDRVAMLPRAKGWAAYRCRSSRQWKSIRYHRTGRKPTSNRNARFRFLRTRSSRPHLLVCSKCRTDNARIEKGRLVSLWFHHSGKRAAWDELEDAQSTSNRAAVVNIATHSMRRACVRYNSIYKSQSQKEQNVARVLARHLVWWLPSEDDSSSFLAELLSEKVPPVTDSSADWTEADPRIRRAHAALTRSRRLDVFMISGCR